MQKYIIHIKLSVSIQSRTKIEQRGTFKVYQIINFKIITNISSIIEKVRLLCNAVKISVNLWKAIGNNSYSIVVLLLLH